MSKLRVLGVLAVLVVGLTGSVAYGPSAESALAAASTRSMASLGVPGIFAGENSQELFIWIEPGVWIFRTAHEGNSDLMATLRNEQVQYTRDLSQEAGAEPQLAWVSITRAGLYRLEIVAEGPWTIEVKGCTCAAELG